MRNVRLIGLVLAGVFAMGFGADVVAQQWDVNINSSGEYNVHVGSGDLCTRCRHHHPGPPPAWKGPRPARHSKHWKAYKAWEKRQKAWEREQRKCAKAHKHACKGRGGHRR